MDRWSRWVQAQLAVAVTLRSAGNPDGEARVWRVETAAAHSEVLAYLKLHHVADKWRRERTILARLAESPAAAVPELLAAQEDGGALLLRACPGQLASSCTLTPEQQSSLHEQAGRLRRRLDTVPVDDDDALPVPAALQRRMHAWIERARARLPERLLGRVHAAFDPSAFEGSARRWSHRDLAPHNWIVARRPSGPQLAVIDFGQARPDVWLVDALKLWDGPWVHEPALAAAFWAGYGRQPSPSERHQLHQLALLHGLATATWGDRHDHAALGSHGRAVLTRALAQLEHP